MPVKPAATTDSPSYLLSVYIQRSLSVVEVSLLRHALRFAAVMVTSAVTVLAATGCSAATPGAEAACRAPSSGAADHAPPITVLTHAAHSANGDIFIAPQGCGYASGPEILSPSGKVIWFHAVPAGEFADDFRTQTYQGEPVLTWLQGGCGLSGTDYIYNDHYQRIADVSAGNGYFTDFHEFLITPWNTALILAYVTGTANLTSMGGPADQRVFDGIVRRSTSAPARCFSGGTARTTFLTATATSRCLPRRARRGTGSTSTPSTSTPTGTC